MRREIGVIINDSRIARKVKEVFEADWSLAKADKKEAESADKDDREETAARATA